MPSGSLQVLGASGAMAAHRRGAPPPKHSPVLFSMPLVSRSPRWVRGKIARFLAGKCSIAVRIDHFGGQSWDEDQVRMIHAQAEEIRDKFPKPKKRGLADAQETRVFGMGGKERRKDIVVEKFNPRKVSREREKEEGWKD